MTTTLDIQRRSLEDPTEVREFEKGRIDLVVLGDTLFGRAVFQPGWRWSDHVKPLAGTASCEFLHRAYIASGTLHVRMDNGTEVDLVAGDVATISPGHDGWVVGDEPCVMYDFGGEDQDYAKPAE